MSAGEGTTACSGCGFVVARGLEGCRELRDAQVALHAGDVTYFAVHRLFIDVYALQHPDQYCGTFHALASHLAHLCWSLEHGGSRAVASERIREFIDMQTDQPMPELPARRGVVTIGDVAMAATAAAHRMAVDAWARSTWDAYRALQPAVREWVRIALTDDGVRVH